jgi:mRNA-degrading endonuclease toxin of MazEF toxin-antitoxin module
MLEEYDDWNIYQKAIQNNGEFVSAYPREVWWCYLGLNVGSEQNGGKLFSRPVLVIRRFGGDVIFAVPITTKIKNNPYEYSFTWQERK